MLSGSDERRVRIRGAFDSLGLAALVGAPVHAVCCGDNEPCEGLPDFRHGSPGPSGRFDLNMSVIRSRSRLKVMSFEMGYDARWESNTISQVATFLDLSLPVSLSQTRVARGGAVLAEAVITPFEAVGLETVGSPSIRIGFEVGSLSGAVSVDWPNGDPGYLDEYRNHSLGFSLLIDGRRQLDGMVLPGGYDIDLDLRGQSMPETGVMALLGCALGTLALFSGRSVS